MEPRDFFRGAEHGRAVRALRRYVRAYPDAPKREFTGRNFEALTQVSDSFEAGDVVAVSMLAVGIPPAVSSRLVLDRDGQLGAMLAKIPRDAGIWGDAGLLAPGGPAEALWDAVFSLGSIGPMKTSKLLAAKRPDLFPVHDNKVGAVLYPEINPYSSVLGRQSWAKWTAWTGGSYGAALRDAASAVAGEAAEEDGIETAHLAPLRVIDIVMWTRLYVQERLLQGRVDDFRELEDFAAPVGA